MMLKAILLVAFVATIVDALNDTNPKMAPTLKKIQPSGATFTLSASTTGLPVATTSKTTTLPASTTVASTSTSTSTLSSTTASSTTTDVPSTTTVTTTAPIETTSAATTPASTTTATTTETVSTKTCEISAVCYGDKDCGKEGRCLGVFIGKCNCNACVHFFSCSDDSGCGGLKGACDTKTNRCDCISGYKANGFPMFIDALRNLCNVKECDGKTDTCYGLPCTSGRCVC